MLPVLIVCKNIYPITRSTLYPPGNENISRIKIECSPGFNLKSGLQNAMVCSRSEEEADSNCINVVDLNSSITLTHPGIWGLMKLSIHSCMGFWSHTEILPRMALSLRHQFTSSWAAARVSTTMRFVALDVEPLCSSCRLGAGLLMLGVGWCAGRSSRQPCTRASMRVQLFWGFAWVRLCLEGLKVHEGSERSLGRMT